MIPNAPQFRKAIDKWHKCSLTTALEAFIVPAIVLVVALGAFGLGSLSAQGRQGSLRVLYPEAQAAEPITNTAAIVEAAKAAPAATAAQASGAYVASKSGTKYYLTTCSSANRIKPENRVYFASKAEAAAAGYGPAANCPGL